MAVRWKIPFVTLTNDALTINIYDSTFSGTATVLKGAPVPFETNENTDTNILAPLRTSTGNIHIVNEGNLSGITPTGYMSRPVTLTNSSNSVLWRGYIQPQQFGRNMYLTLDEVSFPVVDALGVLANVDMDYENHTMQMESFGELIYEALYVVGLSATDVVFPKEWRYGTNYLGWARFAVNRFNWFEDNESQNTSDEDVEKYSCISYLELIENIAKQLGWIASMDGEKLVFTSPAATEYYTATATQVKNYGQGSSVSPTALTRSSISLASLQHASTDNDISTLQGAKKVKIEAKVNSMDDLDIGISVSNVKYVRTTTTTRASKYKIRSLIFRNPQTDIVLYGYQMQGENMQSIGYDPTKDISSDHITCNLVKADRYQQSEITEGTKINYQYSDAIAVDVKLSYDSIDYGPEPLIVFRGTNMPPQTTGCIDLNFVCQGLDDAIGRSYLTAKLKIGNKYYDKLNNTWTTTEKQFSLELDNGAVKTTKTIDMEYEGASHHVIPIDQLVGGDVEFTIYAKNDMINPVTSTFGVMLITTLSVTYCNADTLTYKESEEIATYTAKATGHGQDEIDIQLNMATLTENLKRGFGLLYFGDSLAEAGTPQYRTTQHTSETALLAKMKSAYFRTTEQAEPTVRVAAANAPSVGDIVTWNSKNFVVLSRTRNWRDSEVTIQMQEKI